MDVEEKLQDNFLSCSICLDRYKDPCTLPCQHSFCKTCLAEFMKTKKEAISVKKILCPFCKQEANVPNPKRPVEEWPKQFKPYILLQGLLETFEGECCMSCQKSKKVTRASSRCRECDVTLCDSCSKKHKAMPDMRSHLLTGITDQSKTTCREHEKTVEFYCKNCNKVAGCQGCIRMYHSKCNNVVQIAEVIEERNNGLLNKIHRMEESLREEKFLLESDLNSDRDSLVSEIQQTTEQVFKQLKMEEKRLVDRVNDLMKEQKGKQKKHIKSVEKELQGFKNSYKLLEEALKSGKPVDPFDTLQKIQTIGVAGDIAVTGTEPRNRIFFVKNNVEDIKLGHLMLSDGQSYNITSCEPFETTGEKENNPIDPNDIVILDDDGKEVLVITDSSNKNIKSFYNMDGKEQCSRLQLEVVPFTVTKLNSRQVAVSLYLHLNVFIIAEVNPGLSLHSQIRTRKAYRSLTSLTSTTLAAGCYSPPSVDIIDLSGKVLKTVGTSVTLPGVISQPWYLHTTKKGHILVSDEGSASVYSLTQEGDAIFVYKQTGKRSLSRPLGITSVDKGDILVADYSTDKVTQLTETGNFVCDILTAIDGIVRPQGLYIHRNKLYITQEGNHKIHMFRLEPK